MGLAKDAFDVGQGVEVLEDVGRKNGCDGIGDARKCHAVRDAEFDVRLIDPASSVVDLVLGNIDSGYLVKGFGDAPSQASRSAADFDAVPRITTILFPLREEVFPVGFAERVKLIIGPRVVAALLSVFPASDGEKRINFSPFLPLLV